MTKDFEIKRVVIGLASVNLTMNMPPPQELMPKSEKIMKAIVFLSNRSIEVKEKKLRAKHEEAMVDKDCEKNSEIIYDGDEDDDEFRFGDEDSDVDGDNWSQGDEYSESEDELEQCALFNVCEILFV